PPTSSGREIATRCFRSGASRRRCRSSAGELSGIVELYRWRVEIVEWERVCLPSASDAPASTEVEQNRGLSVIFSVKIEAMKRTTPQSKPRRSPKCGFPTRLFQESPGTFLGGLPAGVAVRRRVRFPGLYGSTDGV